LINVLNFVFIEKFQFIVFGFQSIVLPAAVILWFLELIDLSVQLIGSAS